MEKKIIKTAKELFDAEVKAMGAKYIDEVAEIHFYYVENENNARLYMADEVSLSYELAIFPKADAFLKAHPYEFVTVVSPILDADNTNELFRKLTDTGEKDFENIDNFCYYCDFLMQNALALDGYSFNDEYEEVEEEKLETEEKSKVVEDVVQDLKDALTAQKKVLWSMICNRYKKGKKKIDMKRMPDAIADADGFQFSIQGDGDFFAIVILEGDVKILYRPGGDEEQETYFDWKVMSYEALIEFFYAMA